MAANIPFTSVFSDDYDEDKTSYPIPTEQSINSVLRTLHNFFPDVAAIVHRSGLQSLYESNTVTLFVPEKYVYDENTTVSDAIKFCQNMTSVRCLDRIALNYYTKFTLKTLATPYDLTIESFPNGSITVNGSPIVSSIECANGFIHVTH